jgi:hypothetical protein
MLEGHVDDNLDHPLPASLLQQAVDFRRRQAQAARDIRLRQFLPIVQRQGSVDQPRAIIVIDIDAFWCHRLTFLSMIGIYFTP